MTTVSGSSPLPPIAQAFLEFRPGAIRLGELLVGMGACARDDVSSALERQKTDPRRLGELLVGSGACTSSQIEAALEAQRLAAHPAWDALGRLGWHPELATNRIEPGGPVVAGLPSRGTYLRFDPAEWALAEAIARHATYAAILGHVWEQAGMLVAPAQVAELADRLWRSGLLLDPARPAPARARRGLDWLVWRVPLWDPSRLLAALGPLFKATSTLRFLVLAWVPLVLVALGAFAWHSAEVMHEVGRLSSQYHSLHLGRIYLLLFLSLAVHEFGHAAVLSAHGGSVRQIGVMLYVGMPFGYCDTSEAHRLPLKARIAVGLGGLYYQLGLAALSALAWCWLPLWSVARTLALDMAIVSAVAGAFNLIPFARLDGYYLVADLLGLPNLQERAFSYMGRKILGRPDPSTPQEAMLLSLYGLMGLATLLLLGFLALRFWGKHLGL